MPTTGQILQFVKDNTLADIVTKGMQQNFTQAEIEFALRIKEVMLLERRF